MSLNALAAWFQNDLGLTEERAVAVYKCLWKDGVNSFDEMVSVNKTIRGLLRQKAFIRHLERKATLRSEDGTVKYLWRLEDGHTIESVLIPGDGRLTLCVSSQVGCAMACTFCLTGDLGLKRHLLVSEIASQPLQIQRELGDERRITNLVFMGMGEPLHNMPNLLPALRLCLEEKGLNFSHRRVTVSTVGLVNKIPELADALPVNLAISLNATTEEQRRQIMPITNKYSVEELLQTCRDLPLPRGKRITFEYVMIKDFNDSLEDAIRLEKLLEGIPYKVNLIPYNENPQRDIKRPPPERVKAFQHYFVTKGLNCTVRASRGRDISAACGQLGKGTAEGAA